MSMFRRRRARVAQIREELTCPQCEYSLRGVPGDVATCPECGTQCDLARLIVNQWTGPWYRAPGFHRVLVPVTCAGIGVWVVIALSFELYHGRRPLFTMLTAGVLVAAWGWSTWRLRSMMPGGAAVGLALLAHGILAGYVFGLMGTIGLLWRAVLAGSLGVAAPALVAVLPLAGLMWVCRRGEKYIAERCIRRYLVHVAQPPLPAATARKDHGTGACAR
jgi:hypothetical protein